MPPDDCTTSVMSPDGILSLCL